MLVRYPGTILLGLPGRAAAPGRSLDPEPSPTTASLPTSTQTSPALIGAQAIKRYFAVGELGPSVVLIHHPEIDFRSDEGLKIVEDLARKIALVDNVAEVRAVSRPLGKPLPLASDRQPPPANEKFFERLNRRRIETQEDIATHAPSRWC